MASRSDNGPTTRSRVAQSSSTGSRSSIGILTAPSTSDKVLKALEELSVRKAIVEIAGQDGGVESRIKCAVDDALTGDTVRLAIQAAVGRRAHTGHDGRCTRGRAQEP